MKFGENLRQIRKSKKMSQEQLAEKVNVTRQSVSKWENGESYPEMNNILELCKIFNCKLNNLVHTDMTDISSLDEEIVMNVVKFNEKKQKEVKTLSNVISLIGKIGAIVLKVAIPFIILAMILVPYVINNVEIKNNEIGFKTENIKIIDENKIEIHDFCKDEHCHCEKGIIKSSLIHTLKISIFIFLVNILVSLIIDKEFIINFISNNKILSPLITSIIGLIPNCASSVIITELYIQKIIPFGSCISGLLAGSGVGVLILFKQNKHKLENITILIFLIIISSIFGIIFNLV